MQSRFLADREKENVLHAILKAEVPRGGFESLMTTNNWRSKTVFMFREIVSRILFFALCLIAKTCKHKISARIEEETELFPPRL